jgi:hypothetical protein
MAAPDPLAGFAPVAGVSPELWRCPRCGEPFAVYGHLPFDSTKHACGRTAAAGPRVFHYYYALTPTARVHSLRLVGADAADPLLSVESRGPDGRDHPWGRREEGGELAFYPPPGFDAPDGHTMRYSPQLQRHEPLPRAEAERLALRGAVSG